MSHLVICPFKKELSDFLHTTKAMGLESQPLKNLDQAFYEIPELNLLATTGGLGKVRMALSTQKTLLERPDIKTVFCLGVAGSLGAPVKPLDVVVSSKTIEHDYTSLFGSDKKFRPSFASCFSKDRVIEINDTIDEDFIVHFAPIASGDEDIVTAKRAAALKELTGAVAVAWEGAGAGRACQDLDRSFCEVRGISDEANEETSTAFAKNLPIAMANATYALVQLIKSL